MFDRMLGYYLVEQGRLTGEQIKGVREGKMMDVPEYVKFLNENGVSYNLEDYQRVENNTKVQNSTLERFVRKIGGFPEWHGYHKIG